MRLGVPRTLPVRPGINFLHLDEGVLFVASERRVGGFALLDAEYVQGAFLVGVWKTKACRSLSQLSSYSSTAMASVTLPL